MDDAATDAALVHEIARLVVEDEAYRQHPWSTLALVATIRDADVVQLHGYVYLDDGTTAAETPRASKVAQRFVELHHVMGERDTRPWKAALVQIWRADGKVSYVFEHDDAARWKVTPTSWRTVREELRPR